MPNWGEVAEPAAGLLNDPELAGLHDGERAALAVAASRQPIFLLIDEWPSRRLAISKGFPVTGALGILDHAAKRN